MNAPLGWLQLRHRPLRLLVALLGIAFAVLLIMMQLGFRAALFDSAVRYQERLNYDIALFSRSWYRSSRSVACTRRWATRRWNRSRRSTSSPRCGRTR
jgi:hypothetical protein